LLPFDPLVRNPHAQTIGAALWPRPFDPVRYPVSASYFDTENDVRVLVHSQMPAGTPRGHVLLVHGLEGSSDAGYMRSAAHAVLETGYAAHRFNIRSCGGTESLCKTLYHAGLTTDVRFVALQLAEKFRTPLVLAGFSLGANIVVKLAGELGDDAQRWIRAVMAVSPPLDLRACAFALKRPQCRLYQDRFLKNMAARLRRRHALRPDLFAIQALDGIGSVYEFDDRITAQFFGFGSAERYYGTQSCGLFLDAIRVPALLVHAKDDPMIPFDVFAHPAFQSNPHLKLLAVEHGGHVGFLARGKRRFWVDHVLCAWLEQTAHASGNNRERSFVL
jgi:predicted alpha/beta-fold hydrolase